MGFSVCTQRNKGRSLKGKRSIQKVPLSKGPNLTTCMAVSKENGIIYYETQNEAFDGDNFADFIKQLIQKCKELQIKNPCFVADNCKFIRFQKLKKYVKKVNFN